MKPKVLFAICLSVALAGLTFLKAPPGTNAVEASTTLPEAKRQPIRVNYARLPLSFEANQGQTTGGLTSCRGAAVTPCF